MISITYMLNTSINEQIHEKVLDYGIDDYQSSCKRVIHGSNVDTCL